MVSIIEIYFYELELWKIDYKELKNSHLPQKKNDRLY